MRETERKCKIETERRDSKKVIKEREREREKARKLKGKRQIKRANR